MAAVENPIAPPSATTIRHLIRSWQRTNTTNGSGDGITVWGLPVFVGSGLLWWLIHRDSGGALSPEVIAHVDTGFAVGSTILVFAGYLMLLRALGPMGVDRAQRFWLYSSPIDRGSLLRHRYGVGVVLGASFGLLAVRLTTLFVAVDSAWWWYGAVGSAVGSGLFGFEVRCQADRRGRVFHRTAVWVTAILGSVCCAVPSELIPSVSSAVVVVAAAVAVTASAGAIVLGARTLGRLGQCALASGSDLATVLAVTTTSMDTSVLAGEIDSRRWRSVGAVRSRAFRGKCSMVLIESDFRRVLRDRSAAWVLVAMCILPSLFAAAVDIAAAEPTVVLFAALAVVHSFGHGLRDINESTMFRSVLGVGDIQCRLAHLVVPCAAVSIVALASIPVLTTAPLVAVLPIPFVALAVLYRSTSRPPLRYGGLILETPSGQIPVDMLRQLVRGPLLAAIFVVVQFAVGT